jgi:hypothetical protein
MQAPWTKETLRVKIVENQTKIDRITRSSNFTNIQRRVLLDFRKRAQAATRAFMEANRDVQDTHPIHPAEAEYVLQQYDAYFNALEKQKKNEGGRDAPPPHSFTQLPLLRVSAVGQRQTCWGEQDAPALSMPALRAFGPKRRSTSAP